MESPGSVKKVVCCSCKREVEYAAIFEIIEGGVRCSQCYTNTYKMYSKADILRIMKG